MKNFISMKGMLYALLICSLMFSNFLTAQEHPRECFFEASSNGDPAGVYSYSTDLNTLAQFEPKVFNIFFWGIYDGDGNPGWQPLREEDCLNSVSQLNRVYNEFGIFFKYYGMDTFNSETLYALNGVEKRDFFTLVEPYNKSKNGSFNVYVASGGSPGGLARAFFGTDIVIHHNFYTEDDTMVHEVGHCFNLFHTHESFWAGRINPDDWCGDCPSDAAHCEETVTRNPLDPNYNAPFAGDHVVDTPSMPNFRYEYCRFNMMNNDTCDLSDDPHYYEYVDPVTFAYNGQNVGCSGEDYDLEPVNVKNYMAYNPPPPEGQELFFFNFTAGQKVRMHEAIASDEAGNEMGELTDAQTTIAALYEPYKGTYSTNGSFVGPQVLPTFQPGFDYEFMSCGPYGDYPPPLDYGDLSFWYITGGFYNYTIPKDIGPADYDLIVHKNNFAVYIDQLSYNLPRNCYSATGPASSGLVVKFEDEVFNNNITVTPQDSTGINSPNLINDLQQGLYKIEKHHTDGAVEETVIYKQNY